MTLDSAIKGMQFELGQRLAASIQAQVAPGVFTVRIANQLVQMQLPPSLRSGDTVQLQVISVQPRLTFSMANPEPPLATPEQLGSTARLLSSLSQQPPQKAHIQASKSTPLWEVAAPPQGKQLAGLLQAALGNSGLFYESHQALWLEGARTTLQLLQEPQNLLQQAQVRAQTEPAKLAGGAPANIANSAAGASSSSVAVPASTTAPGTHAQSPDALQTSVPSANPAQTANSGGDLLPSIPEHLRPLVQQQLNALETGQMVWQGNVWPNQPMQWEVHEEAQRASGAEEQRQWVTQIRMDLPNLGTVSATLRFSSAGLSLALNADSEQTRALLNSASAQLLSSISNAGIKVQSTQVANS